MKLPLQCLAIEQAWCCSLLRDICVDRGEVLVHVSHLSGGQLVKFIAGIHTDIEINHY